MWTGRGVDAEHSSWIWLNDWVPWWCTLVISESPTPRHLTTLEPRPLLSRMAADQDAWVPTRYGWDMYKWAAASLQYSGQLACQWSDSNSFLLGLGLGLGLGIGLKFLVFWVVRTQEFGSEFRKHLPKLSAVLYGRRRTFVHISTVI